MSTKQRFCICLLHILSLYGVIVIAAPMDLLVDQTGYVPADQPTYTHTDLPTSSSWPTFEGEVDGHFISVPYYDPTVTEAPPERKKFDLDAYSGLERILVELVDDLLVKRKGAFQLTLYPFKFYNFITKTKAASAELIKQGVGKHMGDDFVKDALVILKDMHKYPDLEGKAQAKLKSKEEKRAEAKQISDDFRKFLNLFRLVIEASPVGKYLDWQKMTIDGKPVAQESARYYNYFENNGYSGALWVMNGVIGLLEKIKG